MSIGDRPARDATMTETDRIAEIPDSLRHGTEVRVREVAVTGRRNEA